MVLSIHLVVGLLFINFRRSSGNIGWRPDYEPRRGTSQRAQLRPLGRLCRCCRSYGPIDNVLCDPLRGGVLHSIHSHDLLACWGKDLFEFALLEYAESESTYELQCDREVAAVTALAECGCCRSDLVRGYLLEWGLAWQHGWEYIISHCLYHLR